MERHSHATALLIGLTEMGLIPLEGIVMVNIMHDDNCPTLTTQRTYDCSCDPRVDIDGHIYLYSQVCRGASPN